MEADLAVRLGRRLRRLRCERGMTLAALSAVSGVSGSYLSAVENGVNLPSLQKLGTITAALGVGLPAVLAEEGEVQVRRAAVPEAPGGLDVSHPELLLRVAVVRAAPAEHGAAPVPTSGRVLFVVVRDGELHVSVDGEVVVLSPGDALQAEAVEVGWTSATASVAVWSACPLRLGTSS